jgi:hypothetical protein
MAEMASKARPLEPLAWLARAASFCLPLSQLAYVEQHRSDINFDAFGLG